MRVGRRAGRLEHEAVAAAHVLLDLDVDLAVAERADVRLADLDVEVLRHAAPRARGSRCP